MMRSVKALHILGVVLFLGSVPVFIVASALSRQTPFDQLLFARRLIQTATYALTLPGLGIVAASGVWMSTRWRHAGLPGWLKVKQIATATIALSTLFAVLPAVRDCLEAAAEAASTQVISPRFMPAYLRESVAGAFNLVLTLASLAIATWAAPAPGPVEPHRKTPSEEMAQT